MIANNVFKIIFVFFILISTPKANQSIATINLDRIFQALEVLSSQKRDQNRSLKLVEDYNVDNVSEKIIRIIISYTDFIKKNIWKQ